MSLEPVNMSRDAAHVILLRTLTVITPGYLGGPSVTTRVLESRDPFPAVIEAVLGPGDGMWAASPSWKGKEINSPRASREECSPADTLILAH